MAAVLPVIILLLMVFALIDIITRDDWQVKHPPEFGWGLKKDAEGEPTA
jgi:hypothetical protein